MRLQGNVPSPDGRGHGAERFAPRRGGHGSIQRVAGRNCAAIFARRQSWHSGGRPRHRRRSTRRASPRRRCCTASWSCLPVAGAPLPPRSRAPGRVTRGPCRNTGRWLRPHELGQDVRVEDDHRSCSGGSRIGSLFGSCRSTPPRGRQRRRTASARLRTGASSSDRAARRMLLASSSMDRRWCAARTLSLSGPRAPRFARARPRGHRERHGPQACSPNRTRRSRC
jgi:hypothetical protein